MDEEFTISTPEQVAFHYETAGIGSRVVAALLDHLIIGLALLVIYCAASALSLVAIFQGLSSSDEAGQAGAWLVIGLLILVTFLIIWGYFVLFEIAWKGRTPGKRAGRLRVIKRSGQPIGAGEAIIRNLVRLVDFMPGFYGVGLIAMFIDHDARRLGDLAAGTIVVREGEQVRLSDVQVAVPAAPTAGPVAYTPSYAAAGTGYEAAQIVAPTPAAPQFDPLPGVSLRGLTPQDYLIMSETLERVRRGELQWNRGQEIASRVAFGVAGKMGYDFREWRDRGWDPLVFIESVLAAREARGE